MPWLIFAFSGPVLWALSTHIDKYLVEKYFKQGSVAVLMVFTAVIGVFTLPVIWFFVPRVLDLPWQAAVVIATSGILYMGAIYFYLMALQTEEASTVAPFFQAAGIFGAILGFIFLGETLTLLQILGILLTIGGSVLLSLRFGGGGKRVKTKLVALMLGVALALALSSLIFKFYAVQDEFWTINFWSFVGDGVFGIALLCIPGNLRGFTDVVRVNSRAVLSINASNELINLGGGLGFRYALLFAPIGIVQSINSTTSFFVLGFGILLSLFLPKLGRKELAVGGLAQKFIAVILVTAGVILVNR